MRIVSFVRGMISLIVIGGYGLVLADGVPSQKIETTPSTPVQSDTFIDKGIVVTVGKAVKTTAKAENASSLKLRADETLFFVPVTLLNQTETNLQTNWRGYVVVQSAAGYKLSPVLPVVESSTYSTPDFIAMYERIEMRLIFRVRESDLPAKLLLSNGLVYDLVLN